LPQISHAVQTSTLSDVLERVLDKGIVIAGRHQSESWSISSCCRLQIRLVICSVDKAREMVFSRQPVPDQLGSAARPY
jgi:hypothetical protein